MQVRDNAVYYVEAWVKLPAGSTADPTVYMVLGFSFQDSANGWSWPGLNVKVSGLSVDNWTKVSGYLTNNRTALKQAMVRISIPNTPKVRLGDAFLIDDLIITDVTDAKAALDAADANAQALSSLSASVTQNGKNITSQGSAITKLQSDVTQLGKDISGKADASALTNLTTRVTATEGGLKSQGDSLTSLQNSLNTTNSNVAKKADATALQSLQNTVEQHGRDLTTQSSALTNLENNFSSLAVGGTNLIRNADTLEGWSSRHATETYLGDRVAYTRLAKGASGYTQLDEQTLEVTGRTEFVFSFYAKGGTIAVGSGTPFRVQRSRATTVSPSDTFDDILVIGTDNQTTLPGGLSAGGNIDNTSKGKVLTQAIELSMSTPYIDFHYNGSSADYTARLIHDRQNRLNAQVQSFWVTDGRITASSTMPANPAIGTQLTSNPVRSLMAGRGAYGDVDGAYVQMYMEEQVGTEHRLVLYADGFGRTDAWIFRAGGTISTGKGDVLTTGSDVRLKDAFMEPQEGASRRINSLGVCEFNMKGETRRRRGFIAQQAEKVDDLYTFLGIEQEIDGEKFRVMNVDYTAIIADLVTVVQDLIRRVDALES